MQFSTHLKCQLPRVRCKAHGVKTVQPPWAGKHSRFTLLFEAFAIRVLQAARSVEEARKLLGLNWHPVEAIKSRAVQRGLARREEATIPTIGIDEKQVTAVALDMWKAYANAVEEKLPEAVIVHDRFHVSQHLNQAVDKVRRQENKELLLQGDERLKGSKFFWITNEENIKEELDEQFFHLKQSDLKVARACAIKELFRYFWDYSYAGCAKRHFDRWYSWAIRSRLDPIKAKARMIKNHLPNLLTYFQHPISNAVAEGLNSKIQTVKSNARGYRSFDGFRNSILFYCGRLNMAP